MSSSRDEEKEQQRFWNEFKIGLLAVAAVALLVFGVRFLQGSALFGGTYPLVAEFENARGLAVGNPVMIRGLSVGTVERVTLGDAPDSGVQVRMQIRDDVTLRKGTTASIAGISALDDVYVTLQRSPEGEPLAAGARLPTVKEGTLTQLRERAMPMARRVDSVLSDASATFSAVERVIDRSGEDDDGLVDNLRTTSSDLKTFVRSEQQRLHRVLGHLERTSASMDTLVTDLQYVTSNNRDSLKQTVKNAEGTFRHMRQAAKSLEKGTADLEKILSDLENGRGTMGRLLKDPLLYRRMDSITLRMDSILTGFQENPRRYINLEIF